MGRSTWRRPASVYGNGVRDTDRVLAISTDNYIDRANNGKGGVGYEKTVVTGHILSNPKNRRKLVPIVRNVAGISKLPSFFGAAMYPRFVR